MELICDDFPSVQRPSGESWPLVFLYEEATALCLKVIFYLFVSISKFRFSVGPRRTLPQGFFTVHQVGGPLPLPFPPVKSIAPAPVEISICICLHVGKHHRVANHGHKNSARPEHFLSTLFRIFSAGQRTGEQTKTGSVATTNMHGPEGLALSSGKFGPGCRY